MPPQICPNCGASVPPDAKSCPECGSDEETGWSEKTYDPQPDLPEEEFDYGEYVKREFEGKARATRGIPLFWWFVAVLLLATFLFLWLR